MWEWSGTAVDEGDEAAAWFSKYLDTPVRLVRWAAATPAQAEMALVRCAATGLVTCTQLTGRVMARHQLTHGRGSSTRHTRLCDTMHPPPAPHHTQAHRAQHLSAAHIRPHCTPRGPRVCCRTRGQVCRRLPPAGGQGGALSL